MRGVRTWDLPIRVFHWLLVALLITGWWTAESHLFEIHSWIGYSIMALLVFRLYWGLAGSASARFAHFLRGPAAVWAYVRTLPDRDSAYHFPGHNPLGGWSAIGMLICVALQVGLGLFAVDIDGINSGPYSDLVSFDTGRRIAWLHHQNFNLLLTLAGLHVAAIAFYAIYKRQNLTAAMLTGHSRRERESSQSDIRFVSSWRVIPGAIAAIGLVAYIVLSRGVP